MKLGTAAAILCATTSLAGAAPPKTVDAHGVALAEKSWQRCTALAPRDWSMVGNEVPVGIGVDLAAGDQTMFASYGIVFVPAGTHPEQLLAMMATQALGLRGFTFVERRELPYGYVLRTWTGSIGGHRVRGLVSYRAFDGPMAAGTGGYVLAYRSGMTLADRFDERKHLLYDVASSVRCQKRLFPSPGGGGAPGGRGGGSSRDLSEARREAMMGYQNVHSPSTGEHWEASYQDWNAAGPEGPGYYRRVGNGYEKLAEGFAPE